MPKEIVISNDQVFGPESSAISIIEVRWGKDGQSVELGMRIVNRADHSNYVPTEEEKPGAGGIEMHGLYLSLDRRGINELVRHARRARNGAFGADE